MNHKMWAQWKDFRLTEEDEEWDQALEMVRALNTLKYEIGELQHKKQIAWGEKNQQKAKQIMDTANTLIQKIKKIR